MQDRLLSLAVIESECSASRRERCNSTLIRVLRRISHQFFREDEVEEREEVEE